MQLHQAEPTKEIDFTSMTCIASHAPSSKYPRRPCPVFEPSLIKKNNILKSEKDHKFSLMNEVKQRGSPFLIKKQAAMPSLSSSHK